MRRGNLKNGECPDCGSTQVRVKNHGDWVGYYCPTCKLGGSQSTRPRRRRYRRDLSGRCKNCRKPIDRRFEFCDMECKSEYNNVSMPDPKTLGADGMAMAYGIY